MTGLRAQISSASYFYAAFVLITGGCGHDPEGPGSYQAVMKATKSAQETLTDKGAKLEQKQFPVIGAGWVVDLSGKDVNSETLASLGKLTNVVELNLAGSGISDNLMKDVATNVGSVLNDLNISNNSAMTDAGFEHLAGLLYLTKLNVTGTKISQRAIEKWQRNRIADPRIHAAFKKVAVKRG